jgi:23S rRNA (guanine2445-N2)-methyltransferase / 23S rRNA (guanine2069-N7)-methyltransferase
MLFSTNARQFKMDIAALPDLECKDITWKTIPKDFERNAKIHQCWSITHA